MIDNAAPVRRGAPSVWVTRPRPGNAATSQTLIAAALPVVSVPLLEVRVEVSDPPRGLVWPEYVLFVSANAVRGLEAALARPDYPGGRREDVRVAAVGRKTAEAAQHAGWRVDIVPEQENAEGLLAALAEIDLAGRRVWIPSGNRPGSANRELPEELGARRAEVSVLPVYETATRALPPEDLDALNEAVPGATVLHSPSSAEALFDPAAPKVVSRWCAEAVPVSIGPVTTHRLMELGANRVTECPEPTDAAVASTVAALEFMKTKRNTP